MTAYPTIAIPVSKTSVVNFRIPSTQSSTSDIAFVISAHRCRAVRGRVLHQTGRIQPQRARIIEEHADSSVLLIVKIRVGRVAECAKQILQSGAALCGKQVDLLRYTYMKRQRLAVEQQRFRIDRIRISRKAA